MKQSILILISVVIAASVIAQTDDIEIQSKWLNGRVVIDGVNQEWNDAVSVVDTDMDMAQVTVGMLNDDSFLYVSLMTEKPRHQFEILMNGLTIWLDPKCSGERKFGIRFPIKCQQRLDLPIGSEEKSCPAKLFRSFRDSPMEIEVVSPEKRDSYRVLTGNAHGIDVQIGMNGSSLIYEIRIPLARSEQHPYGLGTTPGNVVMIGLETALAYREVFPNWSEASNDVIDQQLPGEDLRRGLTESLTERRTVNRTIPKPLRVWFKAELASRIVSKGIN